jgi:hypothetical protein
MGKSLTVIGYWITSLNDDSLFPPQEFVKRSLGADVATYLSSGQTYEQYRGCSWCRFQCGISAREMGSRDLTDGTWVWPEGLAHYVESHDVNLPSRFVDHITSGVRPAAHLRSPDDAVEFGYGETWCRHNLSLDYFKRLGLARQQTNLLTEQFLEEQFHDVEQRTGVSTESCIWAGCPNRALLGIKFCSRCAAKMQPHHPSAAHGIGLRRFLDDYGQNRTATLVL